MGAQNGHIASFLKSVSLMKRKWKVTSSNKANRYSSSNLGFITPRGSFGVFRGITEGLRKVVKLIRTELSYYIVLCC